MQDMKRNGKWEQIKASEGQEKEQEDEKGCGETKRTREKECEGNILPATGQRGCGYSTNPAY